MAVNLTALNTVYNHFLTSYAPKGSTPYDSHKKSELRGVYNSMLKLNKESPLYLIKSDSDTSEFVIGVKENARDLKNRIASLGGLTEESLLGKKIATSTNDSIAEANYIGTESNEQQISKLTLSVKQLATPQINTGTYLSNNFIKMPEENYSFDIGINNSKYEFQFNVYQEDTNKEVQERLSRLINNSNIGIKANILEDGNGNSSLVLESKATGMQFADKAIFTVSDDETSREKGIVAYLGLDQITTTPKNASFRLNGEERSASTNTFTIERQYEITLKGTGLTEDDETTIYLKDDFESLKENINELVNSYNSFINYTSKNQERFPQSSKLLTEMTALYSQYKNDFEPFGLSQSEEGRLTFTTNEAIGENELDDMKQFLDTSKKFAGTLIRKTNQISLNPIEYIDKKIVAYKNPGHNFQTPYVTSNYSGLMFNSYC